MLRFRELLFFLTHSKLGSSRYCFFSSIMRALPRLLRRVLVCFHSWSCSHSGTQRLMRMYSGSYSAVSKGTERPGETSGGEGQCATYVVVVPLNVVCPQRLYRQMAPSHARVGRPRNLLVRVVMR